MPNKFVPHRFAAIKGNGATVSHTFQGAPESTGFVVMKKDSPMKINANTSEIDATQFFHDEEFERNFPGVKVPPPCFLASGAKIIAHEPNKSLTVAFPVRSEQTNPVGSLQGGILASFFDNTFGPLSFATMRKPCVSIDMTVNFVRPAMPGESVVVRAEFKSKSRKLIQLYAEAHNEKQKLIATATTNMLVYDNREKE